MTNLKDGFLLINKPIGPTSFNIIAQLRRITNIKKIGHAGTLDPFASGLLIVAVGREATREIHHYVKLDKEYLATLQLGATTTTFDNEAEVLSTILPVDFYLSEAEFKKTLEEFRGPQLQTPPMFSAKKVNGQKLYDLARRGITIERQPNEINIFDIELIEYAWPAAKIRVYCSSGTYIRTLAYDIGQRLGCGAYLEGLVRTKIGEFRLEDAKSLEEIRNDLAFT